MTNQVNNIQIEKVKYNCKFKQIIIEFLEDANIKTIKINQTWDLRNLYDMEEIDYENRYIPEEVAPYTKEIFKLLKD